MPEMIRVMVVHDQEIVREGVRALLLRRPEFRLVGEACSAADAVDKARRAVPDVVVMGIQLVDSSGVDACSAIHERLPGAGIIMLMPAADDDLVTASILAGASGVILQGTSGDALLAAIGTVAGGAALLDPIVTSHVLNLLRGGRQRADLIAPLAGQERRVLVQIAEGKTNREIALALGLSEKTVKNYVSSILNKLKMHRRSEAAAFVARQAAHGQ
jgi:two-component system, NarL family, response regulator DevR